MIDTICTIESVINMTPYNHPQHAVNITNGLLKPLKLPYFNKHDVRDPYFTTHSLREYYYKMQTSMPNNLIFKIDLFD